MEEQKAEALRLKEEELSEMRLQGFPGGPDAKESDCNAGDPGSISGQAGGKRGQAGRGSGRWCSWQREPPYRAQGWAGRPSGSTVVQHPAGLGSTPRQDGGHWACWGNPHCARSPLVAELSSGHQGLELSVWEAPGTAMENPWYQLYSDPGIP